MKPFPPVEELLAPIRQVAMPRAVGSAAPLDRCSIIRFRACGFSKARGGNAKSPLYRLKSLRTAC